MSDVKKQDNTRLRDIFIFAGVLLFAYMGYKGYERYETVKQMQRDFEVRLRQQKGLP